MAVNKAMVDKFKFSTSQVFNFRPDSYLERTSRPVYGVVFLLPFLFFYEFGTLLINTDVLNHTQVRVVAFVWLQDLLKYLGFSGKFIWAAPAVAVVVILVALQIASGKNWRVFFADILPMATECVLLAVPLIVLSLLLHSTAAGGNVTVGAKPVAVCQCGPISSCSVTAAGEPAAAEGQSSVMADVVTGVGAGIYEELVFRLILICLLMMLFQDVLNFGKTGSVIMSVLMSAALFSAHHHLDLLSGRLNERDMFDWAKFTFRTIAGVYFAILFAIRGFGITAGTHAFYDIIAACLNVFIFGG